MIRRLKCDVIQQLPSKQRCMVVLDPSTVDNTNKLVLLLFSIRSFFLSLFQQGPSKKWCMVVRDPSTVDNTNK